MARTVPKRPTPLKWLRRAIRYQKKTPLTMPLRQRLEMLRRGFRSSAYELYNFAENNPDDYLPDAVFQEATDINGPFCQSILNDKLLFWTVFKDRFKMPAVLALLERGQLHPLQPELPLRSVGALLEFCRAGPGVVIKPADGWQGKGVVSVRTEGGRLFVNAQPATEEAVGALLGKLDNCIVTERIVQDGYAFEIFPGSANSIRVMTMQDPDDDHRPFIPMAMHRFGSLNTIPTDNVSRGGLMAGIDLSTGVMGLAIKFPHETGGKLFWCSHHPDTAAPIKGVCVPGWRELMARTLETVRELPLLRYVGWDFVIAQGEVWLVEANHNSSPAVQIFHPYLKDPKVRRFFEYYGVVPPRKTLA